MKKVIITHLFVVFLLHAVYATSDTGLQPVGQWTGDINCFGVFIQNQKAYIYDSDQLGILDVSNPTSPQKLGEIMLPSIRDVYVSGNYAYVVTCISDYFYIGGSYPQAGLRIIDISDSSSPREVGFYNKPFSKCVYVSGHYAYVGSTYRYYWGMIECLAGSFDIVDISEPSFPQMASQYTEAGIIDIQAADGFTYAAYGWRTCCGSQCGILTFDTSNPNSPQLMDRFITGWPLYIFKANNLLFLTTEGVENSTYSIYILDITDPDSVKQLSTYENPDYPYKLYVSGVYLYLTNIESNLKVLDISDPYSPAVVEEFLSNIDGLDVFVSGDYVYYSAGGLMILSAAGINTAPFGTFETPVEGATVSGSIPVSGWVLDDKEIQSVRIYRNPMAGESGSLTYLGDAVLVEGSRPDVAEAYPAYPMNSRAGWGYTLLTNYNMPNQGNGIVTLTAIATDSNGAQTTLDSKTIIMDNVHAVKPFGTIDRPMQGGIASGAKYINWGWALTPPPNTIPFDGSTINIYVDGMNLGHPMYNLYRQDVAEYFPGYNNSSGAVGYFYLDTTGYEDSVHTITWTVSDDAGNTASIGTHYFTIENSTHRGRTSEQMHGTTKFPTIPLSMRYPVTARQGFRADTPMHPLFPDDNGIIKIEIQELDRIEIHLGPGSVPFSLPVGSSFDREKGIFYWQTGSGFIGTYDLEFITIRDNKNIYKQMIRVMICRPMS